jgi:hypothetical protein
MPEITILSQSVMTDGGARDGRLILAGGHLAAVFVRVSAEEAAGSEDQDEGWFLEAGFGPCSDLITPLPPIFPTLEEAAAWVQSQSSSPLLRRETPLEEGVRRF